MNKKLLLAIPIILSLIGGLAYADDINVTSQVSKSMSAIFQYIAVDFGTLSKDTVSNAPTPDNTVGEYNVTVDTNYEYKFTANATDFDDGLGHNFDVANLQMDAEPVAGDLSYVGAYTMDHSDTIIANNLDPSVTTLYLGYWLSIPATQYASSYYSTNSCTVANV
jgi:hypothetical protein